MPARFMVVPSAYVFFLRSADGTAEPATEVLLQLRQGTGFMDGHWASVAGHVERGESCVAAAVREAAEEVGLDVDADALQPLCVTHRTRPTGKPVDERVDFFFTCRRWRGDPAHREADKAAGIGWFDLAALPSPVVPHEEQVLRLLASGSVPPILTHGF